METFLGMDGPAGAASSGDSKAAPISSDSNSSLGQKLRHAHARPPNFLASGRRLLPQAVRMHLSRRGLIL